MAAQKKKKKPVKISIISNMADLLMPAAAAADEMQVSADLFEDDENNAVFSIYDILNHLATATGSDPERIEFTTDGTLSDDGKRIEVSYDESDLCGMAGSRTTLLFDKLSPGLITMVRTGTYSTSLVFNAANRRQRCMYDTGILPPFELCVLTRRIDNGLSYEGGTLALDYIIEMHGIKTEFNSLLLEVREPKKPYMTDAGERIPK